MMMMASHHFPQAPTSSSCLTLAAAASSSNDLVVHANLGLDIRNDTGAADECGSLAVGR